MQDPEIKVQMLDEGQGEVNNFARVSDVTLTEAEGKREVEEPAPAPALVEDEPEKQPEEQPEAEPEKQPEVAGEDVGPCISLSKGGPAIIILVNPKSGGNVAGELLKLPQEGILVELQNGAKATCFSYPIMDKEKKGIMHLKREVEAAKAPEMIRCIVAGGDGTVMWAIEEIFNAKIPIDRVVVGTIPFGTGNDFGNVTKWGVSGPAAGFLKEKQGFQGLHWYVQAWLRAESRPYDIWEASVKTRPSKDAAFRFIEGKQKKCTDAHIARHGIKTLPGGELEMSKYVCNYMGIGLDARVGIGFDKSRQKNRLLNKVVYGWEGAKKLLFKKKGVISHIVDAMKTLGGSGIAKACDGHDPNAVPEQDTIFSTQTAAADSRLKGNPVSLLFLNIPSIAGGLDIWKWSNRKLGVQGETKDLLKAEQDFGDGRLECIAYQTGLSFYLEQLRAPNTLSGKGARVFSGGGPLRLSFRDPSDDEYIKGTKHCKGRTYMQVDGEFFVVHEPDTVVIRHHETIQVLVSNEETTCCGCCGSK